MEVHLPNEKNFIAKVYEAIKVPEILIQANYPVKQNLSPLQMII